MMNRAVRQSRPDVRAPSGTQAVNTAQAYAMSGWVVEADLANPGEPPDRRFFAVGLAASDEAVEAVLGYPGLRREDRRCAIRLLSREEISTLRLRPAAVRPYGAAMT